MVEHLGGTVRISNSGTNGQHIDRKGRTIARKIKKMDKGARIGNGPFMVKDCALITLATGLRAQNLRELRDRIIQCPIQSIEYHFYSSQLRPTFDDPEYHNDFAIWARHGLHDRPLAERLGVIDPLDFSNLEDLRSALLDVVEESLAESDHVPWSAARHEFIFLRSQVVVFDTGFRAKDLKELADLIPRLSTGSIYYHFVEARRRVEEGLDDFSTWLRCVEPKAHCICEKLATVDYYFCSLAELRDRLAGIFEQAVRELGAAA